MGKIPEIRALPSAEAMAAEMAESRSALYGDVGTEAQRAARAAVAHDAFRLREALKRGCQAVDLQDVEMVQARTLEYLEACELAGRVPLWGGLVSRSFGLSRQFVTKWLASHQHHPTARFLASVREAFADSLAGAALSGSVQPIVGIFCLKCQSGWRDNGADEDAVEIGGADEMGVEDVRRWIEEAGSV